MRKEILMICGALSLLSRSVQAQTCVTPPDCESLGYTKTATDCQGLDFLTCPFDESKYFCVLKGLGGSIPTTEVLPGMIYYSDGTVATEVIEGKKPIGVVAYVDGVMRTIVALEENSGLAWSDEQTDVSCLPNYGNTESAAEDIYGMANSYCLSSQSGSYPAAKYCNDYKAVSDGKGSSGWYLPATGEIKAMSQNYSAINYTLQKLSGSAQLGNGFWSSSESHNSSAYVVNPSDGGIASIDKNTRGRVRCFLTF